MRVAYTKSKTIFCLLWMLPSMKFTEDKVLVFVILMEDAKTVQL